MPNYVMNIIKVIDLGGSTMEKVRAVMLNSKNQIDFELILPMPGCLKDFVPDTTSIEIADSILRKQKIGEILIGSKISNQQISHVNLNSPKYEEYSYLNSESVFRAISNYNECGYMYWYDWCLDNWGTKWNVLEPPEDGYTDVDSTVFEFETADSHPYGIMEKISNQLPAVTFRIKYIDFDFDCYCGFYDIKDEVRNSKYISTAIVNSFLEEGCGYSPSTQFALDFFHPEKDSREIGCDES